MGKGGGKGSKGKAEKRKSKGASGWSSDDEPPIELPPPTVGVTWLASPPVLPPGTTMAAGAPADAAAPPLEATVETLLSDASSATMIWARPCLSPSECAAWIAWAEAAGFERESHAQTSSVAHRDNGRLAVDSPEIAAAIFERIYPLLPATIGPLKLAGCNPNIRL
jgi:hypothetical protein